MSIMKVILQACHLVLHNFSLLSSFLAASKGKLQLDKMKSIDREKDGELIIHFE